MPHIIVLFNLKPDADPQAYEKWARETDLPTVRKLPSVAGFDGLRAMSMLGSSDSPPYKYIEVIKVKDMAAFGNDVGTETMRKVASEFRAFAQAPQFIVCESLD